MKKSWCASSNRYINEGELCIISNPRYCAATGQSYYSDNEYNIYCRTINPQPVNPQPSTKWCQYTNSYINTDQSCNNPCTSNQNWNGSSCI